MSHTILVAEHHEELRKVVASFLDSLGYEVLEATNGAEAIAAAISAAPNFILLDLHLPDVRDEEIARALHKIPETKNIPIMAWTLDPVSQRSREALRGAGIVECLRKPVPLSLIEKIIGRCVSKAAGLNLPDHGQS